MSASQRLSCSITSIPSSSSSFPSTSFSLLSSRKFLLPSRFIRLPSSISLTCCSWFHTFSFDSSTMPRNQSRAGHPRWKEKSSPSGSTPVMQNSSTAGAEAVTSQLNRVSIVETGRQRRTSDSPIQLGGIVLQNQASVPAQKAIWKPRCYGLVSGATTVESQKAAANQTKNESLKDEAANSANERISAISRTLFWGNLLEKFNVDNSTYSHAQLRATFYPKFENEKSDQEVRTRMIDLVSKGLATLEVSLKHSGSLFMYAGHHGGAYAKNSFGNMYYLIPKFWFSFEGVPIFSLI